MVDDPELVELVEMESEYPFLCGSICTPVPFCDEKNDILHLSQPAGLMGKAIFNHKSKK